MVLIAAGGKVGVLRSEPVDHDPRRQQTLQRVRRRLGQRDTAWAENAEVASTASQIPVLEPLFTGAVESAPSRGDSVQPSLDPKRAQTLSLRAALNSTIIGFITFGVLLLGLNLPISVRRDKAVWWWDIAGEQDAGVFLVLCCYVLVSTLGLPVVTLLLSGLSRAVVYVGIAVVGLLLLVVTGMTNAFIDSGEATLALLLPYSAAVLLSAGKFRRNASRVLFGRVLQGVAAGILLTCAILVGTTQLVRATQFPRILPFGTTIPGWAYLALTLTIIAYLLAITAGILGLVSLRPAFSQQVNTAATTCSLVCLCVFGAVPIVIALGIASESRVMGSDVIALAIVRISAIAFAILSLFGAGLIELLTSVHCAPVQNPRRATGRG